jgi:hypothetical protein
MTFFFLQHALSLVSFEIVTLQRLRISPNTVKHCCAAISRCCSSFLVHHPSSSLHFPLIALVPIIITMSSSIMNNLTAASPPTISGKPVSAATTANVVAAPKAVAPPHGVRSTAISRTSSTGVTSSPLVVKKMEAPVVTAAVVTETKPAAPQHGEPSKSRSLSHSSPVRVPTRLGQMHLTHGAVQSSLYSAASQNLIVHYYGIASDPLAFFNCSSTVGGRVIEQIYHQGYDRAGAAFLSKIHNVHNVTQSLCAVAALQESVQAAGVLLAQRHDFLNRVQRYCDEHKLQPLQYSTFWNKQIQAFRAAKTLCVFGKALVDQACHLLEETVVILKMPAKIQDPNKELTPTLVKDIARAIGSTFQLWPSYKIAGCFGLYKKEQILNLEPEVVHAILSELSACSYQKNPAFIQNIRNLKNQGHVDYRFSENRLLHGKWSLSSLRWLVVFYLGFPVGMDPKKTPTFEPAKNEEELPMAWRTAPPTKVQEMCVSIALDSAKNSATLARAVSEAPDQPSVEKKEGGKDVTSAKQPRKQMRKLPKKNKRRLESLDEQPKKTTKKAKKSQAGEKKGTAVESTSSAVVGAATATKESVEPPAMQKQQSEIVLDPLVDLPRESSLLMMEDVDQGTSSTKLGESF